MKKSFLAAVILVLILALVGCGGQGDGQGGGGDQRTLDDFTAVYEVNGASMEEASKPLYETIDAEDDVLFVLGDSPVKIYQFETEDALKKQQASDELIADWETNGRFLLETNDDEAKAIFQSIKKDGSSDYKEKKEAEEKARTKTVAVGETISDQRCEVTIKTIEFSYDVLPDDTSGFYSHYPADSGKVYIHIDTDVKNIQKQNLPCDEILSVEVDYNDGFMYKGFPIPEDAVTGFTYSNIVSIDPLMTQGVRYLVDCPQEVAESQNPVKVTFNLGDEKYEYQMR